MTLHSKAFLAASLFLSSVAFGHGEDKPGPHGGKIAMPGAFHVEFLQKPSGVQLYLLDIEFKNPTVRESSVTAALRRTNKETVLDCKAGSDSFDCRLPKGNSFAAGDEVLVTATRQGNKGVQVAFAVNVAKVAPAKKADAALTDIVVYRSPTCGCCGKWEEHLSKSGFRVTSKVVDDVSEIKKKHGISSDKASCHTAEVAGYFVEGHVPAPTIKRLLKEKPQNVRGITVPGMPLGSPGMEAPGHHPSYEVFSLQKDGKAVVYSVEQPGH